MRRLESIDGLNRHDFSRLHRRYLMLWIARLVSLYSFIISPLNASICDAITRNFFCHQRKHLIRVLPLECGIQAGYLFQE